MMAGDMAKRKMQEAMALEKVVANARLGKE
jgi:hypothetical protein